MKAILIGATGATGRDLLQLLLNDNEVESVAIFVRRVPDIEHEKLTVHTIDFEKPEEWSRLVKGDVLFSCLGTTRKDAGSKEAQWKVDYDYQYHFAKIARENGVKSLLLVSSTNASPKSPFFYARMKGELDEEVQKLGFPKLTIFRPPALVRKGSDRTMERAGVAMIQLFNKVGLFKSMRPMSTNYLADSMLRHAKSAKKGAAILEPGEM